MSVTSVVQLCLSWLRPDWTTGSAVAAARAEPSPTTLVDLVERHARVSRLVAAKLADYRAREAAPERELAVIRAWLDEVRWE